MKPIYKIIAIILLLGTISLNSFVYANDQQDFDDAKTRINQIQNPISVGTPEAPFNKDQRGSIANILSRVFNSVGKIRSIFIAAFDNLTPGYLPVWTGTGFDNSDMRQTASGITVEGDVVVEGEIFTSSGGSVSGGVWEEGVGAIYYNSGSVGIGIPSPDSILHVSGDIKIGNSVDTCDASKAGALRFSTGGFIQLCADN